MSKKALVVRKDQVFSKAQLRVLKHGDELVSHILLDNIDAELSDRSDCETNLDYFQLIPYITLVDGITGTIFTYIRGGNGGESRLVGKCSIGLGGHIEEEPDENNTLGDIVKNTILRELQEEIGVDFSNNKKFEYIIDYLNLVINNSVMSFAKYTDEVSKVHLAIPVALLVDSEMIMSLSSMEEGVITKGAWLTKSELLENPDIELEEWSKIMLSHIHPRNEELDNS